MTTITLPKTPLVPLFMDHDCRQELDAMFRARDLEVARLVLEGAALKCEGERRLGIDDERAYYGDLMAEAIRAMEVKCST